jgi:hypothetical protein
MTVHRPVPRRAVPGTPATARLASLALAALLLGVPSGGAVAQVALLSPELAAKLVPANERPLALAPDGEPLRFRSGPERWEEGAPPAIIDVDRDGTRDFIVLLLVDGESGRRALLARQWGNAPDRFGPAVFYVIIDENDEVVEWAGTPRLDPPARTQP